MVGFLMRKRHLVIAALAVSLAGFPCVSAYGQKPKVTKAKPGPKQKQDSAADSAEPDKVLYDRAMNDIKHRKYTEARLSFQTLINTYPDSEYLAKAKLGQSPIPTTKRAARRTSPRQSRSTRTSSSSSRSLTKPHTRRCRSAWPTIA